jgi:hypothetical protein
MRNNAPHRCTAATGLTTAAMLALALGFFAVAMAGPATPEPPATVTPCDSPQIHQFDFWVGDWLVYDADHDNRLVGLDRVEKHSHGCIIQENLTLITDLYRRPGVGYRLAGIGVNRFDGERWLQLWADNQWGAITMSGSLEANGSMVFRSLIPSRQRDLKTRRWHRAHPAVRRARRQREVGEIRRPPLSSESVGGQASGGSVTPCRRNAPISGPK